MADKQENKRQRLENSGESCQIETESSSLNNSPEGRFTSDSNRLLNIFPEEIWQLILDRVTDFQNLETISNSSPYFRHLLLPQRTSFLFPKVLTQIAERQLQRQYFLSKHILIKCRGVSQTWNKSVDSFLENLPHHFKMGTDDEASRKNFGTYYWTSQLFNQRNSAASSRCQQFLNHFRQTHQNTEKNPFPGRSIRVTLCYEYGADPFQEDFSRILREYGKHLWYAILTLSDMRPTRVHCYRKLLELMEYMPNLTLLDINYNTWAEWTNLDNSLMEQEALPPTLNKLQILSSSGLPVTLFNKLITKNSHVPKLRVCRQGSRRDSALCTVPLTTLTRIGIEFEEKADFLKLNDATWALTELNLKLERVTILWYQMFGLIERKWGNTLKELKINLPRRNRYDNVGHTSPGNHDHELSLALPKLERLRLEMSDYVPLDFLLPMKDTLKYLSVTMNCRRESDNFREFEMAMVNGK